MNANIDISNIVLSTPRLILRSFKPTDLQDFYEYAKVDGVGQMAGWSPHKNIEKSKTILDLFIVDKKTFAMVLKENNKLIGSIGIENCNNKALGKEFEELSGREIGYVLSKKYWGKGLMPEAVEEVINYCFNTLNLDFLSCAYFLHNTRSRAVNRKAGFIYYKSIEYETRFGTIEKSNLNIKLNPRLSQDYLLNIREKLISFADDKQREFLMGLIPNIQEKMLGIKHPILHQFAKDMQKEQYKIPVFLNDLPHKYYEENIIHAYLLASASDFETAMEYTERFLPHISNWAVCDSLSPKYFNKNKDKLMEKIKLWIIDNKVYSVRFATIMLIKHFAGEGFRNEVLEIISNTKSEEYYINMALAWLLCELLIKNYEQTIKLIESKTLSKFVQNKAIQKARESFRISDENKKYLNGLKIL